MRTQIFYTKINSSMIDGFYVVDIHGKEKCQSILDNGGILIDEELHQHLLTLGQVEITATKEDRVYTINDKDLFREIPLVVDTVPQPPTLEERMAVLEELMMGVI